MTQKIPLDCKKILGDTCIIRRFLGVCKRYCSIPFVFFYDIFRDSSVICKNIIGPFLKQFLDPEDMVFEGKEFSLSGLCHEISHINNGFPGFPQGFCDIWHKKVRQNTRKKTTRSENKDIRFFNGF